jgi:flagellar biosynthesis anti-sigma factor FlgM
MRIDPNLYPGNTPSSGVQKAPAQPKLPTPTKAGGETESPSLDGGDTVELSGNLGEVQQLKTQLLQMPEVRASRVAALQQQVQQGTYQPSNEQIAGALFSELFAAGRKG